MVKKLLLSSAIALSLTSCTPYGAVGSTITVKGKVLVKGQAPKTYVGLKVNSRKYYNLVGRLSRLLRTSYQGKKITIRGNILSEAIGIGMPARLEVTKIIEIHSRR